MSEPSIPPAAEAVPRRVAWALVAVLSAAAVGHQFQWADWWIEDAAISFAYSRNLASGEGLVPWPGGERVEGYSNPTWVLLLALPELLGIDGFQSSKFVQGLLAALTVPLVYLAVREIEPKRYAPAVAGAGLLAVHSQYAHWSSSGLETSLLQFFLALAFWRGLVELRRPQWPLSALVWFLVAITRPEGILYAFVAGLLTLVFTLADQRSLLPTLRWLLTFFLPFFAYHGWRYQYFAWELPNTYYAKIGTRDPNPLEWDAKGWKYLRNWSHVNGHGYVVWLYFLGLVGGRGWRIFAAIGATFLVALGVSFGADARVLLPTVLVGTFAMFYASWQSSTDERRPLPVGSGLLLTLAAVGGGELLWQQGYSAPLPAPPFWTNVPMVLWMLVVGGLPLMSWGVPGFRGRWLAWGLITAGGAYVLYVGWDWMANWRWTANFAVPLAVLFGAGVGSFGDVIDGLFRRPDGRWGAAGWLAALTASCLLVAPNVLQSQAARKDTTPQDVRKRVDYMRGVAERLHLRERVRALDVDQGAHLYFSDFEMLDIAGLIDVPMAQGRQERAFVREYLFEERRPHFAHVHAAWANSSKIPTHAEWRRDYFEIPGYPSGAKAFHVGNHIRKDLVISNHWSQEEDHRITFSDGIELRGWRIPSPVAGAKRKFYLEVAVSTRKRRPNEAFRVVAFVSNAEGQLASWELPPGYDWYPPDLWGPKDVWVGKFSLSLPPLPPGNYDLGLVFLAADGSVLPPAPPPPGGRESPLWHRSPAATVGGEEEPARFARGEVRFADALQVTDLETRAVAAKEDREAALNAARDGRCPEAEAAWWLAWAHRPQDKPWETEHRPEVARAIATCYALAAQDEPADSVDLLARAHDWDHQNPSLAEVGGPVGERLWREGLAAREAGDWEVAYRRFFDLLRFQPQRAWARRYAEEARAHRLDYEPDPTRPEAAPRAPKPLPAPGMPRAAPQPPAQEEADARPDEEGAEADQEAGG